MTVAEQADPELAPYSFLNLIPLFASINALSGLARHDALMAYARSKHFTGAAMLPMDALLNGDELTAQNLIGRLTREAWMLFRSSLDKETPGKAWASAHNLADRKIICRHLKIDQSDPLAFFATFPFRILHTADGNWIAAAIGHERLYEAESLRDWRHIDIHDVILWNPRTGETRLAGDPSPTLVECADYTDGRYTIFTDGFAFFRAWADNRAQIAAGIKTAQQSRSAVIPREPVDNGMPGALVIGDINAIRWRDLGATVLVAGDGTDPEKLKRAIYRSANLPRVEAPAEIAS